MGLFRVVVEDEKGNFVDGVSANTHVLDRYLLPNYDWGETSCFLRFIDPYGDTTFNTLQIKNFLVEWQRLVALTQTPEEKAAAHEIEVMARKYINHVHVYLKFYGD